VSDEYVRLLDDLADEHAELDAVVASLSETEWSMRTPAEGWTIRDSVLHLALSDEAAALAVAEPASFAEYRERPRSEVSVFGANRALPSSELLSMWRQNRQRLLEALHQAEPKRRVNWFGPSMSAMSHATARLMETWAHGQDVCDALGRDRPDTARLKHIAHLGVRTRAFSYTQHGLPVPANEVYVELIGPDNEHWRWGDTTASDRVSGPARDFCLVVVQRRHLDDTELVTEGPHSREWLLIAQAFAGSGTTTASNRRLLAKKVSSRAQ
jgi:uncharacterized protein (TIGR03084 family)